ncbi:MAG TPA: hypothetical protein VI260_10325 [Blastocatellia bacterium]|jgi:hypothetical protein
MRSGYIHHVSIIRLGALALLVLCLFQPKVRAQEEVSLVFHTISWGMARGQTARFTIFNPSEPVNTELTRQVTFVDVMLMDARDAVIAQSDEIAIPPGEFRSVDFKRDDLSLAGDLAGRVQTRAQVRYRSFYLVDRTRAIGFSPTSIELIDDDTGLTTPLVSQQPKEIVVVGSKSPAIAPAQPLTELPVIVYSGRALIGLAYRQRLRVNAFYPGALADPQRQSVRTRVSLYDANGALLAQSAEATIAPGEFHSFDFDRAEIPASGEPVGGRIPMRVSLEASATDPYSFTQDPKATGPLAASLELIDNSTGRTTAVWLTVGFFEVTPAPKPQ